MTESIRPKFRVSSDQQNAFQAELDKIINHYKRITPVENVEMELSRELPSEDIKDEMKKLYNNLNKIIPIIDKLTPPYFPWEYFSGWEASYDKRNAIAGFPDMVKLMHQIVNDSINSESYKIAKHASGLLAGVAMQAAQLLRKYGVQPTTSLNGTWFKLTKYILLHGCGRVDENDETKNKDKDETVRHYLKFCLKNIDI